MNGKQDLNTWTRDIERLHRIDGFSWEDIEAVCAWYPQDRLDQPRGDWDGWHDKCRSPAAMRRKRDGEPKFAKMLASYHRGAPKTQREEPLL